MNVHTITNIIDLYLNPVIAFLSLAGLLGLWFKTKEIPKIKTIKFLYFLNIFFVIFRSIFITIINYWVWSKNPQAQQFLPPHQPISYVIMYSFNHYWFVILTTIFLSIIFWKLTEWLNKKFDERFFYSEEPILIAFGILVNPWPQLFLFVFSVIIFLLIFQIINFILTLYKSKSGDQILERIPMLYLWIPCALISLFMHYSIIWGLPFGIWLNQFNIISNFYKSFFIF